MKAAWLALALFLAGCTQPATRPGGDGDRAATENPRARIHAELAAQYYARRQYAVALEEVREALGADAGYAPAYSVLGLVHAALLEDKEAEASFRRAIELAPRYSDAHNNFGYFLCLRERRDEAMKHFELAWKNPLYATPERALANAGHCALRHGDLEAAEQYAQRALVRDGNQPQAMVTMADIHFRRGNPQRARAIIRQLEDAGGLDAGALWLALRLERAAGNREAEADYGLQLRRHHQDAPETAWLLDGRYDLPGGKQ
ncbi:MAG: type IV pilus biogenesis/stability protein PilW [Gallionellaceae bacterium]|nr:type IV pilus biogenesis/stability protein PilW [Gallionellaceae bacterium]